MAARGCSTGLLARRFGDWGGRGREVFPPRAPLAFSRMDLAAARRARGALVQVRHERVRVLELVAEVLNLPPLAPLGRGGGLPSASHPNPSRP